MGQESGSQGEVRLLLARACVGRGQAKRVEDSRGSSGLRQAPALLLPVKAVSRPEGQGTQVTGAFAPPPALLDHVSRGHCVQE